MIICAEGWHEGGKYYLAELDLQAVVFKRADGTRIRVAIDPSDETVRVTTVSPVGSGQLVIIPQVNNEIKLTVY